jgi:competence protein ComFC
VSLLQKTFPPCCVSCSSEGSLFCEVCCNEIDFLYFTPKLEGLDYDLQVLSFYLPPLSIAIKAYKYQGVYKLAPIFASLLYKHLIFAPSIDIITSVPLHKKKRRLRGFDQTKLVAKELSLKINKPYFPLLKKIKHTQNLASTSNQNLRSSLVENSFVINKKHQQKITSKHILLFDDVVTSGNTLRACAEQLSLKKPKKITIMTLAHGG